MAAVPNRESAAKNHLTVLGLAALLSLLNVSSGASAQPNRARQQEQGQAQPTVYFVRNPDPAPEFQLSGLDGKPISLAAARGKIILLNFWASWCGPCRAEVPGLIELQERYKDRLQVIGLIVDDDDMDAIHQFVKDFGINYAVGVAPAELRAQYGGIPGLPTSFVLDTQGRVVQKHVGLRDPALYETEIRALLGLPTGVKVETFEDTGEIFLKHADRASELPGVDFSKLTAEQKKIALHRFNAESCNCGCTLTLAQCRINDSACQVSKTLTAKIIGELGGTHGSSQPSKSTPAAPGQQNAPPSSAPPARPNARP
jgi:cytochrome c biogenesis protein CcmG, thiol:disulfide interchange protein DsbE